MAVTEFFIRYLQRHGDLAPDDLARLRALPTTLARYEAGETIVKVGSGHTRSGLLLRGMAARVHQLPGREPQRAVTALHVPGEFMDLASFVLDELEYSVVSIGSSEVEFIDHVHLTEITERCPHLMRLLWMSTAMDGAIHRRWLVAANALRSSAHLAHLLCETYTRLSGVGAARDLRLTLPLLQRELADVLGYSSIHINRAVRDLRDRGLVTWTGTEIHILDWPALCLLARFDPVYLELERRRR